MADESIKVSGFIGTAWKFGIHALGILVKNISGVLAFKTLDDTAFINIRAKDPLVDDDLSTKRYVDAALGIIIISRQADTSTAIPSNTGTSGFLVVTTFGNGAVEGDLLYDDGSSSGLMTIIPKKNGQAISVTQALTGGTISFTANSIYTWDEEGGSWIKIGDIGNTVGSIRVIRYPIDNSPSQDSTEQIPENARILSAEVEVVDTYSGGSSLKVGNSTDDDLIFGSSNNDINLQAAGRYIIPQDTGWGGSALAVRTTISNTPATGTGFVLVKFSVPLG